MTEVTIRDVHKVMREVHPDAVVSSDAMVGAPGEWRDKPTRFPAIIQSGVIVREAARVHAGCLRPTIIGARTLLMAGSHVGHDAQLGADCEVAPNAVIGGCATIGKRVKIGMNASILPYVAIGDGARVGAGAVVTKDVAPGATVVGNPARPLAMHRVVNP